ncbi:MAG: S1 family peptidase [Oscillospiraceae bacterium]|nr:S1 family peptidase [Oscillospiraceae bacterium]
MRMKTGKSKAMWRNLLAVGLAAAMLLSVGATANEPPPEIPEDAIIMAEPVKSEDYAEFEDLDPKIRRMMEVQVQAGEAWQVMYDALFEIHDDGGTTYPDNFAGGWLSGRFLHIALTDGDTSAYDKVLADYASIIVYEKAEHSLNDLDKARFIVSDALRGEGYEVGHGVDEVQNKINLEVIDLDRKSAAKIDTLLSAYVTDSKRMSLDSDNRGKSRAMRDVGIDESVFIVREGFEIERQVGLCGGDEIVEGVIRGNSFQPMTGYTLGACGTVYAGNGIDRKGFITTGHIKGISVGKEIYTYNGNKIGKVTHFSYGTTGGYATPSDWAFIEITNSNYTMTNKVYYQGGSPISVVGNDSDPPVGRKLHRYGISSGHDIVEVTERRKPVYDGVIVSVAKSTTKSLKGDSGGPYYTVSAGQATFSGIHSGEISGTPHHTLFIPPRDFGLFTVKKN